MTQSEMTYSASTPRFKQTPVAKYEGGFPHEIHRPGKRTAGTPGGGGSPPEHELYPVNSPEDNRRTESRCAHSVLFSVSCIRYRWQAARQPLYVPVSLLPPRDPPVVSVSLLTLPREMPAVPGPVPWTDPLLWTPVPVKPVPSAD